MLHGYREGSIYSGMMFAIEEGVGRARRHMTEGGNKEFSTTYH